MKTALLACSTLLALAYGVFSPGWYDAGVSTALLAALKASGIVLLAVLGLMHRSRLLAAGLMFGAAGDALLAWSPETFLLGAGAFLVGHLCYITLFTRTGIGLAALREPARLLAMGALAVAAVVSTSLLVPRDSGMFAPLGVYTGVLTLMAMSSFTLPWPRWLAMAGAVLFFISDGFVAANLFHPQTGAAAYWMNFSGWMIYWAGQAAICFGALGLHKSSPQ